MSVPTESTTTADPGWDDPDYTRPPGRPWGAGRAFTSLFLALVALVATLWVWTITGAGNRVDGELLCWFAFVALGLVWAAVTLVALVLWVVEQRRPGAAAWVPPIVALVLVVLTVTSLPNRVRFEFARADFDAYAAQVLTNVAEIEVWATPSSPVPGERDRDLQYPEVPGSLGGIGLTSAQVVPEGLLLSDDEATSYQAGYAFLPDGEFPQDVGPFDVVDLGGGWYSFSSRW
jgi:hypothetical protein